MNSPDHKTETQPKSGTAGLPFFDLLTRNDMMLWPYRSMSKALLRTHSDLTAFVEANRKLADEMREIFRREQDLALQITERMLKHGADAAGDGKAMLSAGHMEELYDSAVAGVRELGRAVADAQVRSIESLRSHARTAMGQPGAGAAVKPGDAGSKPREAA